MLPVVKFPPPKSTENGRIVSTSTVPANSGRSSDVVPERFTKLPGVSGTARSGAVNSGVMNRATIIETMKLVRRDMRLSLVSHGFADGRLKAMAV